MIKRIKGLLLSVLMATVFPVLLSGQEGPPKPDRPDSPPAEPETPPVQPRDPRERVRELEEELTARLARLQELEGLAAAGSARTVRLEESLKQTIHSYKELMIASNPDVLPELISGETIEALKAALAKGQELTDKVKTNLETRARLTRIPAGAPPRGPEDLSALSAREKIGRGIRGQ